MVSMENGCNRHLKDLKVLRATGRSMNEDRLFSTHSSYNALINNYAYTCCNCMISFAWTMHTHMAFIKHSSLIFSRFSRRIYCECCIQLTKCMYIMSIWIKEASCLGLKKHQLNWFLIKQPTYVTWTHCLNLSFNHVSELTGSAHIVCE